MARYLLDTNILSDLIRNPGGAVARRIAQLPAEERSSLCTSMIVAAELRFGAARKNSARLSERVEAILAAIEVLPLGAGADVAYAGLRAKLERSGLPVGGNDLLIGAHVLAADCVLVTDNKSEFRRMPGLRVENWLRPRR
jgi:tRNA(fMet)-specific endonuclease VapC